MNGYQNQVLTRTVRITTQRRGNFPYSFAAADKIDLGGATVIDSFDSSDSAYSTNGRYDPTKRKDNGNVGSTAKNAGNILKVVTSHVYGKVATGAGSSATISSSGSVGELSWVDGGSTGIQPGHFADDLNVSFDEVENPFTGGSFVPTSGVVDGTNYTYHLTSGKFQLTTLLMSGSQAMVVTGDAILKITEKIDYTGNCHIRIKVGASLKLYMEGGTAKLSGNGVINETGNAANFFYYGLPTNNSLELSGSGKPVEFIGTFYAPNAKLKIAGETTVVGAILADEISVSGDCYLHYDEALAQAPSGPVIYVITSWDEI